LASRLAAFAFAVPRAARNRFALLNFVSRAFDCFDAFDCFAAVAFDFEAFAFDFADFAVFFAAPAPAFVTRPFTERVALTGVAPLFEMPLFFVRVVVDRVRAAFRPPPTFLTLANPAPSLMLRLLLSSGYVR
jgi:hypothetical protein